MHLPRHLGEHQRSTKSRKRLSKAKAFPSGVGYNVPVPQHLLTSPAWLTMSHQCRKLVDALMVEWASQGGQENGNLKAPYNTLKAAGIRGETILDAICEAKALGIVNAERGRPSYGLRREPSIYRLTCDE